jgi:hypothetical protein
MSLHQNILDEAYDWWKSHDETSYSDMVDNLDSADKRMAVLAGKYNYQVENGGHIQYFDNGYASRYSNGGCFAVHEDIVLHQEMIAGVKLTLLPWSKTQDEEIQKTVIEVLDIMEKFRVEIDTEEYREEEYREEEFWDEEDDEYYTETVQNEEYGEVLNSLELNVLDTRYYEVNEKFMDIVEQYLQDKA